MLAAGPALADSKAGVDAWERGDYRTAVEQWRAAADAGDADAQFNMGQAYKLGRGVPVDTAKAEDYYRKAAAQGHFQAEDNYGLALFQNGKAREAIPYLEKSVARGRTAGAIHSRHDAVQRHRHQEGLGPRLCADEPRRRRRGCRRRPSR